MIWEGIIPGRGYVDLAGDVLYVERVTVRSVFLIGGRRMNIWDFRLRVMPSGGTTAGEDKEVG